MKLKVLFLAMLESRRKIIMKVKINPLREVKSATGEDLSVLLGFVLDRVFMGEL